MTDYNFKELNKEKWLKKEELTVGQKYICCARNFTIGTWNGTNFDYMRTKFGSTFPDTEDHWDDGAPFGTVKPFVPFNENDSLIDD